VDNPVHRMICCCAAHILCVAITLILTSWTSQTRAEPGISPPADFPELPRPPVIEGLLGFPQVYAEGRNTYLALVTQEAEQHGLPAAVADAVAFTASGYRPFVVGKAGAVGLMQVRFERARRLGYTDGVTGLFKPETNARYGVMDLAEAWRLANGDLCRAVTKYMTGQDEEHVSVHSAEYCRRVRGHLAAVGSPLAGGAEPITAATTPIVSEARRARTGSRFGARSDRLAPAAATLQQTRQAQARSPLRVPAERGQRFWAAHEARIRAITAKLKTSRLRIIAAGSTIPSAMGPRMRGEAR
jgi:transglycosylase-like protein with SLT domain